ncbi:suppressor of fused domain protein [Paenibacillus sp. FSL K6-1217]|uniref:suppressor of fused domain protein n=1 Tax=Paenibacillus sp. FSL K6-1217 TaxID=2921466 RepID=UPI00324507B2
MAIMESTKERELSFDIRRTVILGAYMREWQMPEYRIILSKPATDVHVEVYYFPAVEEDGIVRFATVGLSAAHRPNGQAVGTEWVMPLTADLGGESVDRVFTYLCDLIAHHIESAGDSLIPRVMEESLLAPANWSTSAFLLDELSGESEDLEEVEVGSEGVQILWAVPITGHEAVLILREGVEAFDSYIENIEHSIIDPRRPLGNI